jgi:RNA polymerase sigma factor (sigma-70 family)
LYLCDLCKKSETDDSHLIWCIQQHVPCYERAVERLLDRYAPLIARVVSDLGQQSPDGHLSHHDADDARQGARIGILDAAQNYDSSRGVKFAWFVQSYCKGGAQRRLFAARGLNTRGLGPQVDLMESTSDIATHESLEDIVIMRGFGMGDVGSAVNHLPEPQRDLLELVFVEGLSLSELARARSVSRQTVAVQKRRAVLAAARELRQREMAA